jgi:hypothetical protein
VLNKLSLDHHPPTPVETDAVDRMNEMGYCPSGVGVDKSMKTVLPSG